MSKMDSKNKEKHIRLLVLKEDQLVVGTAMGISVALGCTSQCCSSTQRQGQSC